MPSLMVYYDFRRDRELASPRAESLLTFWEAHRGAGGIPDRHAFTPHALRAWLGFLSIYKYDPEADDFLNALEGTLISQMTGQDWTGKWASEVDDTFGSEFRSEMKDVLATLRPASGNVRIFQKDFNTATRLLMPVAAKGSSEASQVFLAMFPKW